MKPNKAEMKRLATKRVEPPARSSRKATPLFEPLAFSIKHFCAAHDLSLDKYFGDQRRGIGPATMKVGGRTLISFEAAAAWRREREAAAREQREQRERGRKPTETAATTSA